MHVIIFGVSGVLIRGRNVSEKACDGAPWSVKLLRMTPPSLCIQNKFWFKWKVAGLGGQKGTMHLFYTCACSIVPSGFIYKTLAQRELKNFKMLTTDIKPNTGLS